MTSTSFPLRQDALLWGLGRICQVNRTPFDPALVAQNFPPPYTLGTFLHAPQALNLKTQVRQAAGADLSCQKFPLMAVMRTPVATEERGPTAAPPPESTQQEAEQGSPRRWAIWLQKGRHVPIDKARDKMKWRRAA